MHMLDGPVKYHTKRGTFRVWGWNAFCVYIFAKEFTNV
jgi:hypothetical protein